MCMMWQSETLSDWEAAGAGSGTGTASVSKRVFVSHFKRFSKLRHQLELRQGYTSVTVLPVILTLCKRARKEIIIREKCLRQGREG